MDKAASVLMRIVAPIEAMSRWSGRTVSFLILAMMGVVVYEVISRYVFSSPTNWAQETTTQLFVWCALVGAYTHVRAGHVRMDLFYRRLSTKTKAWLDFFTGILALGYLGTLLAIASGFAATSWKIHEFSGWSSWAPPLYPFKTAIALAVALLLVQQIAVLMRCLAFIMTRREPYFQRSESF